MHRIEAVEHAKREDMACSTYPSGHEQETKMIKAKMLSLAAALILSLSLVAAPSASISSPAEAAHKVNAMIKCHKIKIAPGNPVVGFTIAHGGGKNVQQAKTAARKAAQAKTPKGYRLRHCTYDISSRF